MKTMSVFFVLVFACLTARAQDYNGIEISVEPDGKGLMEVLRDHQKDPRLFTELRKGSVDGVKIECSELRNLKSGLYWLPEGASVNQERLGECLAYENSLVVAKKTAPEPAVAVKKEETPPTLPPPTPPVKVGVPVDKLRELAAGNLPSAETEVFSTDTIVGGLRDDKKPSPSAPLPPFTKIPEVKTDSVETLQRVKTLTTAVLLLGSQNFGLLVALVLVVVRQRRQSMVNNSLQAKLGVLFARLEKLENRSVASSITDPGLVFDGLLARVSALEVVAAPGFTATASNGHANGHTNGHSQVATLATAVANGHQVVSKPKASNTPPPELVDLEKKVRELLDGTYFLDFSIGLGKRRSSGELAVRVGACSTTSRWRIKRLLTKFDCEMYGSDDPGAANFKYILSLVPKKAA